MKRLILLITAALISLGLHASVLSQPQVNQIEQTKIKSKRGSLRVADKSKPVRRALESQYAKLAEANKRKDLGALLALRAPDFSAQFADGRIANSDEMAAYSKALIEKIQPPISVSNTIETLTVNGNVAAAVVHQRFSRMQLIAGQLRKVKTEARQRETWVYLQGEWKLKFADDVHPGAWYVDGKRIDPSKPYDPNAPPFDPAQENAAQTVQKLERAWLDAYEQHDEKAMAAIVADDFTITFPDGSMQTKPQIIASLKTAPGSTRPTPKFHTEDVQARAYGDTVILIGRVITEYQRNGQTMSKEQQRYTDTYVKRNGRWQVVASHLSNDTPRQRPE